jgi:hypothetical protein
MPYLHHPKEKGGKADEIIVEILSQETSYRYPSFSGEK